MVDEDGNYVDCNDQALLFLECSRDELLQKNVTEYIPPGNDETILRNHKPLWDEGGIIETEYYIHGSIKTVLLSIVPVIIDGKKFMFGIGNDITEQRKSEQKKTISEEKYRTLFNTMAQGVVYQNADGEIISANPAAEKILGLTLSQMQGRTSMDPRWKTVDKDKKHLPGEKHPAMVALRTGEEVSDFLQGVFIPERNEYVWIIVNAVPQFKEGSERPYQVYSTFLDVTDRVNAEMRLKETLSATTEGIWSWDFKTDTLFFSDRYYQMLGYQPQEFKATFENWINLIHPDDREQAMAVAQEYLKQKPDVYENNFRVKTKRGDYRWIQTKGRVVRRDENGEAIRMIGNHEDITYQKKAEIELLKAKQRLEDAEKTARIGNVEWYVKEEKGYWSDVIFELYERDPSSGVPSFDEIMGFHHPDDAKRLEKAVKQAITQAIPYGVDLRTNLPSGKESIYHAIGFPIRDENGEVSSIKGTVQDVTDHKKIEEELRIRYQSEQVISKISSRFINPSDIDQCVTDSLKELGQLWNTSRSYVFMIHDDKKMMSNTHEWCSEDISSQMEMLQNIPVSEFPWWMNQLKKGDSIQLSNLSEIPDEGWKEKENLARQQIKSLLVFPLCSDEELFGFVGFDTTIESHEWTDHEKKTLFIFSEIISTFLQKKKIEEILVETKERLSLALKGGEIGTWDWDLITDNVRFDERWAEMLGYNLDEIEPHISSWERLVHVDDLSWVQKELDDHLKGNTSFYDAEFRMQHRSGRWIWILGRGKIIERDENDQPIRMTGTHVDITEMKSAQEEIVDAKKLYQDLFLNAQVGLFRTDIASGKMLEANNALASFVGYRNLEEMLADEYKISDYYVHPEDRNRMISELQRNGEVVNYEVPFNRLDGSVRWIRFSARISDDKQCIEGVSEDITVEHNAVEMLRESEERFRNLSEMLPEAVIETDEDLLVTFANDKALNLMGYSSEDVGTGVYGLEMFPPGERERVKQNLARRIEGEDLGSVEYQAVKSAGEVFPVLVHANPILKDGVFRGVRAVIVDISDLKRVQEELKSLNEKLEEKVEGRTQQIQMLLSQKDEFINQLGHDIKNPLGPLVNLLPLLEKNETDPKKKNMIQVMNRNVMYIKNLVTRTIQLAQLKSPSTGLNLEEFDLGKEIQNIIGNNQLHFKDKQIIVDNNISEKILVTADKLKIQEVFNNLLNNAVKYNKKQGTIIIDHMKDNDTLTISIKDTGMGMIPEQLRRVFDEFYKADSSRHDFDSSGLGMAITKRIIDMHNGKIWAESEGPGKGSTFYFTLPIVQKKMESKNEQ